MKHCKVCGTEIPAGRLKVLPHATTCTEHSTTSKFVSNVIQHGELEADGFQEIEIIRDPKLAEALNSYKQQQGKYQ
jgi:hypothetical protein